MTEDTIKIRFVFLNQTASGIVATDLVFETWHDFSIQWERQMKAGALENDIVFLQTADENNRVGLKLSNIAQIETPIRGRLVDKHL